MRILFASSEVAPFSKTGGLGDVAFALPRALAARGHEVLVLSPLYGCVDRERHGLSLAGEALGGRVWVAPGQKPRFAFWESASHFDRPGIYGYGGDYPDNAARFVAFSKSLLPAARALGFQPEVVHLNDWQTAAATLFSEGIPTVLTIHNLGYQGLFPLDEARHLFGGAPPPAAWLHHGQLGLLKGGILTADLITTVSPTYAREIRETELGFGLGEPLRRRGDRLVGILNGIDTEIWDPATDPHLPAHFSRADPSGKAACKRALQQELGLAADDGALLLGVVSRIAGQKGFDILLPALDALFERRVQLAVLGEGDEAMVATLQSWAKRRPDRLVLRVGFFEGLAHRIYAGADALLMPSSYEPCGLAQLYALRYGTVPVVRATGGLRDTVREGETGFSFEAYRPEALLAAVDRALATFADRGAWEAMVDRAMAEDHSWDRSAAAYEQAYAELFRGGIFAHPPSPW